MRAYNGDMKHTFARADLILGEGQARRTLKVRDVALHVVRTPGGGPPAPASRNPFLDGRIRAEGTFLEECRPSSSQLAAGRQGVLKLKVEDKWSLLSILIVQLGPIQTPGPNQRLYEWSF